MKHSRIKPLVALFAFAIAVALIAAAGLRDGWVYSMHVDEFLLQNDRGQRYRLTGVVGNDNVEVSSAGLTARFDLTGATASLRVEYSGVIPDMFRAGHEVIVEGRLNEDGIFIADTLLTKCGSRYESEGSGDAPQAPHPAGGPGSYLDRHSVRTESNP